MAGVIGALPWLAALAALVGLVALVVWWPLRLDVSGRARGMSDGSWVVGGGVSLSVVSVALVWARGVSPQLSFLIFGRKLSFEPRLAKRRVSVPERVKAASRRAWRRLDPLDLALKVVEERKHVRLRYLLLDLAYGFRDPVLTGRLVGAIAALSAVLPRPIEVRQAPRWDFEDGWEIVVDGRAIVRPWLMLLDTGAYVVRQLLGKVP